MFAIDTTANASLISHRSTSSFFQPARASTRSIAPAGAVVNHSGACAWPAAATMRASGFQPRAAAASAAASTSAAAPSLIDDALPAVTVPSFWNAGRSAPSFSMSPRPGSSSSATTVGGALALRDLDGDDLAA